MKHSKVISKLAAIGGATCLALSVLACPITTLPVQAAAPGESEVQPLSDNLIWNFMIVGNKLYRRLYNYSTGNWVGEWEFVGYVN